MLTIKTIYKHHFYPDAYFCFLTTEMLPLIAKELELSFSQQTDLQKPFFTRMIILFFKNQSITLLEEVSGGKGRSGEAFLAG